MHYDEALQQAGSATSAAIGEVATAKALLHGFARPCTCRWPEVTQVINSIDYGGETQQFFLPVDAREIMGNCLDQIEEAQDNAWPEEQHPLDGVAADTLLAVEALTTNTVRYWEQLGVQLSTDIEDYFHFMRLFAAARSRVTGETLHFSEIGEVGNVFVFTDFLPPVLATAAEELGGDTALSQRLARTMIEHAGVDEAEVTITIEPGAVSFIGDLETTRKINETLTRNENKEAATRSEKPALEAEDRANYRAEVDFTTDCPLKFDDVLDAMDNPEPRPIIDRWNWDTFIGNSYQGTITLDGKQFSAGATEKDGVVTELELSPHNNASFLGIPFHMPTSRFIDKLDEMGLPWADSGNEGIVLYEHWVSLYNHHGRIEAILWYNPETLTDIELLDIAFPPDPNQNRN